jgi:hypothetical protein
MAEVACDFLPKDRSYVIIRAGNVNIRFEPNGKKLKITNRWKPESRLQDPDTLFVPPVLFWRACRMAAAILLPSKIKKPVISLQPSLFEVPH